MSDHASGPRDARFRSIVLFGAPGVGKGTQGERLGAAPGYVHLATGDIFRSLDRETPEGKEFTRYSTQGLLVPDDLTMRIWQKHVRDLIDRGLYTIETDLLVLDGMPRSVEQAEHLADLIDPIVVLHLAANDEDEMVRRIKQRGIDSGRSDDTDEHTIRRRFVEYREKTAPVLAQFDDAIVRNVDALGSIDEVHGRLKEVIAEAREAFLAAANG
ncbi:MAG: adenylate kinase family protein [Phycisphaerales bacterium]